MRIFRDTIKRRYLFLLLFLLFILNIGIASAQLNLPPGVQAIKEYNQQYAMEFLQKISIPLVFLAGFLSFISPCILPLIPAFFSYTFKEKREITKMTFAFFFGFSTIFIIMGIAAAYFGQSIASLQGNISNLVLIAGVFLIFFGLLAFFGKGFSSFIRVSRKTSSDKIGVFLMGISFAVGWSACLGPILAGVLLIASALGSVTYATLLLFVYSLGIMTPLFILSVFYDRFNIGNNKWIRGKGVTFHIAGKSIVTHTTEMISGFLLMSLGLIFILFGGTSIINLVSPIGSSSLFNEVQGLLMNSPIIASIIGLIVLVLLVATMLIVIFRKKGE